MITPEERAALEVEAKRMGIPAADFVAAAEKQDAQPAGARATPTATAATATEAPKIFAYHLPYMTVREIRASIGLTADVADGDLVSGEWLAKHGASPTVQVAPTVDAAG